MPEFVIREAEPEDAHEMAALDRICFTTPWMLQDFVSELCENELAWYLICLAGDRIVGYAGLWAVLTEGHITNVAVDPAFRRRGLGRALVSELISRTEKQAGLRRYTLEVRVSNAPAIRLYEKSFGFSVAGRRKGYYADTKEDALIMWRGEQKDT